MTGRGKNLSIVCVKAHLLLWQRETMGAYTITGVKMYDGDRDSHAKNVVLKAKGKTVGNICKSIERTTDLTSLQNLGDVINECYIDLTLNKLRELDSDVFAQSAYIKSRSRFLDQDHLRMLVIKLTVENGQKLNDQDYAYLLSLLKWRSNDLPLMPVLEFGEGVDTPIQIMEYEKFVKQMLELRTNYDLDDIAMSIPLYLPRRNISKLFDTYADVKPTFIALDLDNKRIDSLPDGKYETIRAHFNSERIENTFIYGMNVKPYKNGGESTSALDVQSLHWAYNATGPTHHKFVKRQIISTDWSNAGRIFESGSLEYTHIKDNQLLDFNEWAYTNYGFEFDQMYKKNTKSVYTYLKRYNYQKTNAKLAYLSQALNKGETETIDEAYDMLPSVIHK